MTIEIEKTRDHRHVEFQYTKEGPVQFFYDNESILVANGARTRVRICLEGYDYWFSSEQLHMMRLVMDAFDDQVQQVENEGLLWPFS